MMVSTLLVENTMYYLATSKRTIEIYTAQVW